MSHLLSQCCRVLWMKKMSVVAGIWRFIWWAVMDNMWCTWLKSIRISAGTACNVPYFPCRRLCDRRFVATVEILMKQRSKEIHALSGSWVQSKLILTPPISELKNFPEKSVMYTVVHIFLVKRPAGLNLLILGHQSWDNYVNFTIKNSKKLFKYWRGIC